MLYLLGFSEVCHFKILLWKTLFFYRKYVFEKIYDTKYDTKIEIKKDTKTGDGVLLLC